MIDVTVYILEKGDPSFKFSTPGAIPRVGESIAIPDPDHNGRLRTDGVVLGVNWGFHVTTGLPRLDRPQAFLEVKRK